MSNGQLCVRFRLNTFRDYFCVKVILIEPYFVPFEATVRAAGGVPVFVPLKPVSRLVYLFMAGPLYFCPVISIFFLSIFFSSPNLSGHRLDLYHTSTHGVALVRI